MQGPNLNGLGILVLDDDVLLRKQIAAHLERMGADVTSVATLDTARRMIRELSFDFALIDVNLPDGSSMELLKEKAFSPGTGIIVMTGNAGVAGAVEAMKLGALDYLVKPFEAAALGMVIHRAKRSKQSARLDEHRKKETTAPDFFFGQALAPLQAQIHKILHADQRVQGAPPPVLIIGETGTGKTTIARIIHQRGPRAAQPLVEMNCSALPDLLAESELFGHERGAFTDAHAMRMGLFEAATGGTLFLDELPSLSTSCQSKVLTALEAHKIRRVGGNKEIPVDVRFIAATNSDLKQLVVQGRFREDLLHRLDLFRIVIPPLRERGGDILALAEAIMGGLCKRYRLSPRVITTLGRQRLLNYHWPGNVRELANELERAVVFEDSEQLDFEHLVGGAHASHSTSAGSTGSMEPTPLPAGGTGSEPKESYEVEGWLNPNWSYPQSGFSLEEAINRMIQKAMQQTKGNLSAASRLLGVTRDYVRYRVEGPKQPKTVGENTQPEGEEAGQ